MEHWIFAKKLKMRFEETSADKYRLYYEICVKRYTPAGGELEYAS